MTTVIEELNDTVEKAPDRSDVEQRVSDWKRRVEKLYDAIQSWLPSGLTVDRTKTVSMHEPMQRHVGLDATDVKVMYILRDKNWIAKIIPRGLWIIGANGRLDLYADRHFIIVDRSEILANPSWEIAPASDRRSGVRLERDTLIRALPS